MSEFNPKELLEQIMREEKAFREEHHFAPYIKELSFPVKEKIFKHVSSDISNQGLEAVKAFLGAF